MRVRTSIKWSVASAVLLLCLAPAALAQPKPPQFQHVKIIIKTDGGPCLCMAGIDASCCPAYFASVNEDGSVKYIGIDGVKVRGEKTHSISPSVVRDLVANFLQINFFSLQDEYRFKKLPDGTTVSIDHSNATTISIDLDGKQKSVYIFFGAPDELLDLRRNLYEALQIAEYIGRA